MPVTININNLTLCHKGSNGISTATIPDVCKTPSPGGPVPIPYPNIAMSMDLMKGTTTVKADGGMMCANYGSEFFKSTGDEPGVAGGVVSSTFIKEATWITFSFDVKLQGKAACRLTDKMFHNHQNTVNMGGLLQSSLDLLASLFRSENEDCKSLAKQAQEGDVVLRSTPGSDSDLIRKLGKCDYSHAGIVTKNAAGDLVVVDAMPRAGGAVQEESLEDFFCHKDHGPPDKGMIARPNDSNVGAKASQWAQGQTNDPAYKFDIFSDFHTSPKDVYCSDFVHQAFQNAGVDLVPSPVDFMSPANKANTLDGIRDFKGPHTHLISDSKLEGEIKKQISNFEYITPCQVANNPHMTQVASFS